MDGLPQLFQFLIGTLETANRPVLPYSHFPVSIPHRYVRNFVVSSALQRRTIKFQFLIGTLETWMYESSVAWKGGFQFLIGTLETVVNGETKHPRRVFQFLIGTLETSTKSAIDCIQRPRFQFLIGTLETDVWICLRDSSK